MKLLTEFLGSFLFMGAIAMVAPSGSELTPLAIGAALMCAVYMGGHHSGAHFNPAVSLAVLMQKKMTMRDFGAYCLAQILGAIAAFCLGAWITGAAGGIGPGIDPTTAQPFTLAKALTVEIFFTTFLALVVLNTAAHKNNTGKGFYGLAIGFTIVAAAAAGGWISGGAFNPAVGIGATASKAIYDTGTWDVLWIYIVGPLLGGALGSVLYSMQHPELSTDAESA